MEISVRRGEVKPIPFEIDDDLAMTVEIEVIKNNAVYLSDIQTIVDGKATLDLGEIEIPVGDYEYILTVIYEDGPVEKYPDPSNCESGDCDLYPFIVCEGEFIGAS